MLCFNRINIYDGIDINKTSVSKDCNISHYWYFQIKCLGFQPDDCNGCHNVLMMFMNLSNIATLKIHGADYCCITSRIIKSNTINLQNIDLTEKSIIL